MAGVGQPRDSVTEWEERCKAQFTALKKFASRRGCSLIERDLPPPVTCIKPGREVSVYHDEIHHRVWKVTFPGQSGFGQSGYFTPAGYLRRLRLSNLIFGDDVEFEGIWSRREGPSIVTSQSYIQPHPERFIPPEDEIISCLDALGFHYSHTAMAWERDDGVVLADTHDRNFIRAPDGAIVAIDVQPRLLPGFEWDSVRRFPVS